MFGNGYNGYGGYGNYGAPAPYAQQVYTPYQQTAVQQQMTPNSVQPQQAQQKPALQVPWVNGVVGAQAYMINPNSSVLLMDSDDSAFYIKSSDLSGKSLIRTFKYEEVFTDGQKKESPKYVTKEEFEEFKNSLLSKKEEEVKE